MPITERTLKRWRKEALRAQAGAYPEDVSTILFDDFCIWIIKMTQELLDQHLLKGNKE